MGVWIETSCISRSYFCSRSHPSWVCGLKLNFAACLRNNEKVTPFVGVWIETVFGTTGSPVLTVTPFVGVWIETVFVVIDKNLFESHPSWVCGLKPFLPHFWGVWNTSHPSWVCGLKQASNYSLDFGSLSHPSWVCGLKQNNLIFFYYES